MPGQVVLRHDHVPGPAVPGGEREGRSAVLARRLLVAGCLVQHAELGTGGELAADVAVPDERGQRRLDRGQFGQAVAVLGGALRETELRPRPYRRIRVGRARVVEQEVQPLPALPVLTAEAPPARQRGGQPQRGVRLVLARPDQRGPQVGGDVVESGHCRGQRAATACSCVITIRSALGRPE